MSRCTKIYNKPLWATPGALHVLICGAFCTLCTDKTALRKTIAASIGIGAI
jgi:hypothetical protein